MSGSTLQDANNWKSLEYAEPRQMTEKSTFMSAWFSATPFAFHRRTPWLQTLVLPKASRQRTSDSKRVHLNSDQFLRAASLYPPAQPKENIKAWHLRNNLVFLFYILLRSWKEKKKKTSKFQCYSDFNTIIGKKIEVLFYATMTDIVTARNANKSHRDS